MELITASAIRQGVSAQTACEILACVTTEEAVRILEKTAKEKPLWRMRWNIFVII